HLLAGERMRPGTGGPYPPRPHSGTLRPADSTRSTRVRRSRTISNQNCDTSGGGRLRVGGGGASGAMQTMLPVVSEAAASTQLLQFPAATAAKDGHQSQHQHQHQQQMASVFGSLGLVPTDLGAGAGTSRHTRTLSGTHLPQDVMGALASESSDFLSSFRLHDEPLELGPPVSAAAHPASSQGLQQPAAMGGRGRAGGTGRPDVDLEAMTTLSAGCAGSIDFSSTLKPFLWAAAAAGLGDDGLHGSSAASVAAAAATGSVAGETQSLVDLRHDADNAIDLYRPASLTPTSGRRFLGMSGGSGAAGDSIPAAAGTTAAVSPVAPRSAASTPGRREAVEI
ncbi:hypothetical protein GGH99_005185, partial [Coemansia sp. RSA 1285]